MKQKVHFIGIGGIGMSGLARIALERGSAVSGSDVTVSNLVEELRRNGANITSCHSICDVTDDMSVVYSSGVSQDNPALVAAREKGCQVYHRSDFLKELMSKQKGLAVTGTHGKTTTSALLAWVLKSAGLDPSFAVGGLFVDSGVNGQSGAGEFFVAEADESDGSFLAFHPEGAIITNIGLDHLDYYKSEDEILRSFKQFADQVVNPEHLLWCGDDERLRDLDLGGISYGFGDGCQVRAFNCRQSGWAISFDVVISQEVIRDVTLPIVGRHNILNACAVFGLARQLGLSVETIKQGLATFPGVARRCEKKGEVCSVLVVDDYAHHPTEIATTLSALKRAEPDRRLVVLFQPHRYSRTEDCLGLFGEAFHDADLLVLTDIYTAGEDPRDGIDPGVIAHEVDRPVVVIPRKELALDVVPHLRPHDLVVTLGAGDITKVGPEILERLKVSGITKLKVAVLSGGRSVEHDISHKSAENIIKSLSSELYDVTSVMISRSGEWSDQTSLFSSDLIFPVLHGPFGEDGTIQGLCEILDKPYVGPDFRSAAIAMDKILTKKMFAYQGIPTPPFIGFSEQEWRETQELVLDKFSESLTYPLFVKASHLGSSVGVYRVEDEKALVLAIEKAFSYDTHVIVETGIVGREIEFAVIGNDDPFVFPPGEVCTGGKFYDFNAKYGEEGFSTDVIADLPEDIIEKGRALVKEAYTALGCTGMARLDTFLDEDNQFWINEVNPIPGFTSISLFPKMCEAHGLTTQTLLDKLVRLGLTRHRYEHRKRVEAFDE